MPPRILSGDQGGYASPQGGSFISKVPTWVWYGVGIIAAIVIIMRLRSGGSTGSVLQSGTQGSAGAADTSTGMLGAPNTTSTLGITSPNGSSVNLGNVTFTPADVSNIISGIIGGGSAGGSSSSALPTGGGTPTFLDWQNTNISRLQGAKTADIWGEYLKETGQWVNFTAWSKGKSESNPGDLRGEYIKETGQGPLQTQPRRLLN